MVKIRRERPSQRLHHRVVAPLRVEMPDGIYEAADWSLTGFGLEAYRGPETAGDVVSCKLTLPFQGFDIAFDCEAVVVWRTDSGRMGLSFTQLGDREHEIMRHFVDDLVRGSMVSVEDTILRIDSPVTPVPETTDTGEDDDVPVRRRRLKAILMTAFYAIAGLGVLAYAALVLYSNFWRLEIDTAVVSAPVQKIYANADGRLVSMGSLPGDRVGAGTPLFLIEDPSVQQSVSYAEIAVERAAAELRAKRGRLSAELDQAIVLKNQAAAELRQAEADVRSLERQVELAQRDLERVGTAAGENGTGPAARSDLALTHAALSGDLERARLVFEEKRRQVEAFRAGPAVAGNEADGRLSMLRSEVDLYQERVRLAEAELLAQERHRTSQVLTAPTDGRVISTLRPPQTFVRRGDELALFERDEQRTIQAFLTQEEVLQIGLGDKAIIYLPSRDQRASAVVTHIDRTMGFVDEMDSQFIWRGPRDRSARVTLEFVGISEDALRRRYQPGLPAVVIFERRSTSEIQSRMVDKVVVPIKVRPKTGDATTQKSKP